MYLVPQKVQRGRPKKAQSLNQSQTTQETTNDPQLSSDDGSTSSEEKPKKERKPRVASSNPESELSIIEGALTMAIIGASRGLPVVTREPKDGIVIAQAGPQLVASIMQLARQDKNVRKYLFAMTQQSAYVNIGLVATFSILLPILDNHNLTPRLFSAKKSDEGNA